MTPVDSIKDIFRSSVRVPEFGKHLRKAGGLIGRIKDEDSSLKPLMTEIEYLIIHQRCVCLSIPVRLHHFWPNFNKLLEIVYVIHVKVINCIQPRLFDFFPKIKQFIMSISYNKEVTKKWMTKKYMTKKEVTKKEWRRKKWPRNKWPRKKRPRKE